VIGACASAPPPAKPLPPMAPPRQDKPVAKDAHGLEPPPPIDLAVVIPGYDEARPWPLSELPSTQPHWDVAMARDACSDAWRERHASDAEARAYVGAWCRIRKQDRGGIEELARLARGARAEIAKPARLDVMNLAADWWDAQHAMAWLESMSLGSVDDLDRLMGTYVGLGMRDEARVVVAHVSELDRQPKPLAACERLIATARVNDVGLTRALGFSGAGDCDAVAARARCALHVGWIDEAGKSDATNCAHILDPADSGLKVGFLREYSVFQSDPKTCATHLVGMLQLPGAEAVAVAALENLAHTTGCHDDVAAIAQSLLAAESHSTTFDARLSALAHCR
jgi:hypothetical protein